MTDHAHAQYVEGCYRCDLSRDEVGGIINEEMVEEAAAAAFERAFMRHAPDDLDMPYSSLGDPIQESWRVVAREALSAVLPGIVQAAKAEAWDEGHAEGSRGRMWDSINPYQARADEIERGES